MIRKEAQFAGELAAREAIRDCLHLYARGIDRCDAGLLRAVFWPEATIDTGGGPRTVEDFVAGSVQALQSLWESVQHIVGNVLIRLSADGAAAAVEAMSYGYHCSAGERRDLIIAGRYVDRFERRDGEWRIARRVVVTDWFRHYPDSGDWAATPWVSGAFRSAPGRDDPSYALFEGI